MTMDNLKTRHKIEIVCMRVRASLCLCVSTFVYGSSTDKPIYTKLGMIIP